MKVASSRNSEKKVNLDQRNVTALVVGRTRGVREYSYFIDVQAEEDGFFLRVDGELDTGRDFRRQYNFLER